ncbi:TIGR02450 family Trp-rich protein [Pseudomonas sp. MSSRFD41]|uniref:TIGR02450 family Trp-rich protein n=1 Tax=unclassified Pseudomonas TaxID=196821 RepID=UPI00163AAC6F|nr:TIGR02450 family Trp-rich protein [Pseudomonas sp. MSSRFD41]MBC2658015.1 TIGR02450 family Trp-rich protein [Pseudomonas sp. MSSRFD41]
MNRVAPCKLLLSRWTAAHPLHREKHLLVTEMSCNEESHVLDIQLQAVLSRLEWQALKDDRQYLYK